MTRRDHVLAVIVLLIDQSFKVNQFQKKKSWEKLFFESRSSAHLKNSRSSLSLVTHKWRRTKLCTGLLASLPESYSMLVTALETYVPQMEVLVERLLHEERKQMSINRSHSKAMMTSTRSVKFIVTRPIT